MKCGPPIAEACAKGELQAPRKGAGDALTERERGLSACRRQAGAGAGAGASWLPADALALPHCPPIPSPSSSPVKAIEEGPKVVFTRKRKGQKDKEVRGAGRHAARLAPGGPAVRGQVALRLAREAQRAPSRLAATYLSWSPPWGPCLLATPPSP